MSYRCNGDNTISNKSTVPVAVYSVSAYKSNDLATLCHDSPMMQWKELCSFYPTYVSLIFFVIERKWKRNCCHVELFTKDTRILYFYGVWIILLHFSYIICIKYGIEKAAATCSTRITWSWTSLSELIMLLIISDLESISHYITADRDGPLSHSEEPAQFLSLFFSVILSMKSVLELKEWSKVEDLSSISPSFHL